MLYELCTLEHAFSADNLLGLVFKIVQDKHSPIPDVYSEDLKNMVEHLLYKDSAKRPLVSDLLVAPFAAQKMQEFIENGGFIGNQKLPVRKIKPNKIESSNDVDGTPSMASSLEAAKLSKKSKSSREDVMKGLSPKEKFDIRKRRAADEKARLMMEHTRVAVNNYTYAKKRNYLELNPGEEAKYSEILAGAGHKTNKFQGPIVMGNPKKVVVSNYVEQPIDERNKSFDTFAANDRDE